MTAIEVLERAISKLEQMRDEATPGPWIARYDGDDPYEFDHEEDIPESFDVGGGRWIESQGVYATTDKLVEIDGFSLDLEEAQTVAANVDLVAALSRTVEPVLALLRKMLDGARVTGSVHPDVLALARAILGEEND